MNEMIHVDPEELVSYLYDECDPGERARVSAHLETCGPCADKIAALTVTRKHLAGWAPPDVALGFQITRPPAAAAVQGPALVLRPARWWSRPLPAWAQAAAAIAIFGAGLAVGAGRGNVAAVGQAPDVKSQALVQPPSPRAGADTSGGNTSVAGAAGADASVASTAEANTALARQFEQLRDEFAAFKRAPALATSPAPASTNYALLEQVKTLIDESEQRQRTEFTLRATQLARDFNRLRQVDVDTMTERIGRVQGEAGALARMVGMTTLPR